MHVYFFHTTALFGLYSKDLKARRLRVVDEAQFSIFLFETTQNVAYKEQIINNEQLKGRENVTFLFLSDWYIIGVQCLLNEWVYMNL